MRVVWRVVMAVAMGLTACGHSDATRGDANADAPSADAPVADARDAGSSCARLGLPSVPWPVVGGSPSVIRIADFNRDGHPDLMIGGESQGAKVLLGTGDGTFADGATYSAVASVTAIGAGDLDTDGNVDVMLIDDFDNVAVVLLGSADGTFRTGATRRISADAGDVALADVNGDGKLDLLISEPDQGQQALGVSVGNGDGTFGDELEYDGAA